MQISFIQNNRFVEALSQVLKQRLKVLKENIVVKAALLIDPKINYLNSSFFGPEEKEEIRVNVSIRLVHNNFFC